MLKNEKLILHVATLKALAGTLLDEAEKIEKSLEISVKVSPKKELANKLIADMLMKRNRQRLKKQSKQAA